MAAVVAEANESDLQLQAAAAGLQPALTPAAAVADARPLDPRLLMAARRGDSQALKYLLQLNDDDDQHGEGAQPPRDVILEMGPRLPHDENAAAGHCCCLMTARQPPAAAPAGHSAVQAPQDGVATATEDAVTVQLPPPPVPVLDEDGVTTEGDSLLHVVAACGDTQEFLDCAKMIVRNKEKKGGAAAKRRALEARNNKGDTPLHCAAGAGNAQMVSCLAALITTTTDDDNEEAVKKAFLRMQNDCGETALHQAIRAAASTSNKQRQRPAATNKQQATATATSCICIDQLMGVDPELACIPHEDGASPLYLAISLGEIEIAEHLYVKSNGKLSYSGPDGRNVLHAAVHRGQALQMILGWLADARPLDPRLLMAARRGDSKALKDLLQLNDDDSSDDQQSTTSNQRCCCCCLKTSRRVIVEVDPPAAVPVLDEDGVTMEGDSLLHVVAACGNTQEFLDCVDVIVRNKEKRGGAGAKRLALLEAPNSRGDTPLHCAARAGNANMISCLVDLLTEATAADEVAVKTFLGRKNRCGETALHQAVRAASKAAIDELLSKDLELAEEDAGGAACSPFFLAVSLWGEDNETDIARHLFDKTEAIRLRGNLSYYCSGPDGRNVLHAAVSRASVKTVILLSELLTSADAASGETQTPPGRLLLWQLASQRDKENGSTPLHLAASLGGLPSSWLFFAPQVPRPRPGTSPLWPSAARESVCGMLARLFWCGLRYWQILPVMLPLVLNANVDMAYQPDKAGLYPIHVAAGSGSVYAVWMLLDRCPDCATLRDVKGRTLLHVAAEEGRYNVVKYVCEQSQKQSRWRGARLLPSILNAQDMNGDTPLHYAVRAAQYGVVRRLIRNQKVRLDVPNNMGMRPIDVSWTKMPLETYYPWDLRIMIRRLLLQMGAPYGENNRGDLFRKNCILSKKDEEKMSLSKKDEEKKDEEKKAEEKMSENLTAASQVLALFSVLITTVTFASAFTLPGGIRSAGDSSGVAGTPVLGGPRRSYAFDAFILADALAFGFSLLATSILLYAGVPAGNIDNRFRLFNFAYGLMWHSGRCLLAAFGLGLFMVLLPVARSIAIAVAVLMIVLAVRILKESEGFNATGNIPMIGIGRSRRQLSPQDRVIFWILFVFNHFWSYILIFGFPAIRRWPRFTLSPY